MPWKGTKLAEVAGDGVEWRHLGSSQHWPVMSRAGLSQRLSSSCPPGHAPRWPLSPAMTIPQPLGGDAEAPPWEGPCSGQA